VFGNGDERDGKDREGHGILERIGEKG